MRQEVPRSCERSIFFPCHASVIRIGAHRGHMDPSLTQFFSKDIQTFLVVPSRVLSSWCMSNFLDEETLLYTKKQRHEEERQGRS